MMEQTELSALHQAIAHLPAPPLFVTVSGAHLYGFPSPDSDVDLRGAHVLPLRSVIGLDQPKETCTCTYDQDGREVDLVSHDISKFIRLMLRKNGYVLEQLYSPLVVHGGPAFEELQALGRGCITRHLYHHYAGFSRNQIERFEAESPRRVKTLLYVYRVLMTGIWVLKTGQVEANILHLNEHFSLPLVPDLIAQKLQEKAALNVSDLDRYVQAVAELQALMEQAFAESSLPEAPTNHPALNDYLVRVRLEADDG